MNHLLVQANLCDRIICDSAGTSDYHIGNPPDRRMSLAAAEILGIELRGRARQFHKRDFLKFDLILAMDQENYYDIQMLDPTGQYKDKIRLMCDFCSRHILKEVPDPYYGGVEGFKQVIELLVDACEGIIEHLY